MLLALAVLLFTPAWSMTVIRGTQPRARSPVAAESGPEIDVRLIVDSISRPEPLTIFTLEESRDGWDDVRGTIKGVKTDIDQRAANIEELKRVLEPVASPVKVTTKWVTLLSRELVQSANRLTMARDTRAQSRRGEEKDFVYPMETHWTSTIAAEQAAAAAAEVAAAAAAEAAAAEKAATAEASAPEEVESVSLLQGTIFTFEERRDGWDDIRGVVRSLPLPRKRADSRDEIRGVVVPMRLPRPAIGVLADVADAAKEAEEAEAAMEAEEAEAVPSAAKTPETPALMISAEDVQMAMQSVGAVAQLGVALPAVAAEWTKVRATELVIVGTTVAATVGAKLGTMRGTGRKERR